MTDTRPRQESLFGHLVGRFSAQPENIATEALRYVLMRSAAARRSVHSMARQMGVIIPADLTYRTQVTSEETGIYDLVGFAEDNSLPIVIEAKFGAALTENQPAQYLQSFDDARPSLLLMLAPQSRLTALWSECRSRCREADLPVGDEDHGSGEVRWTSVGRHVMGIISWRSFMDMVEVQVAAAGVGSAIADLQQLRGMVDRMEADAFIPFRAEDLAPERGRMYEQLIQVVEEVVEALKLEDFVSLEGLRTGGRRGAYGRYFRIHDSFCFIGVNPRNWHRVAETPLWLAVYDLDFKGSAQARRLLAPLERKEPPRLYMDDSTPIVPLFIPTGRDRTEVVRSVKNQIIQLMAPLV